MTAFMRSLAVFCCVAPMNRSTTNGFGECLHSDFFGSYENTAAEARGGVVRPTLQWGGAAC